MARALLQVKVFSGRRIAQIVDDIDEWLREHELEPLTETVCSDFVDGILISATVTATTSGYRPVIRYLGAQGNTGVINDFLEQEFNTNDNRNPLHAAVSKSGWDIVILVRYEQIPIELGPAVAAQEPLTKGTYESLSN